MKAVVLFFGLAAAVRSVDKSGVLTDTAPMTCPEYAATIEFQQGLVDTCRGRSCRSANAQLRATQGAFSMYCNSASPTPSPSIAPVFSPPAEPCHCMGYGDETPNTLVFGNFNGTSDTEGRLFVGGNAHLETYSVGQALPVDCDQPVLKVAGALEFLTGRVYSGSVEYGSASEIPVSLSDGLTRGCTVTQKDTDFDFAGALTSYQTMSNALCQVADTGIVRTNQLSLDMSYTNQAYEVYSLPCENFTAAQSISFGGMSDTASVVLNLRGTDCLLNTEVHTEHAERILFNLCDATSVQIVQSSVRGSLMAPFADVTGHGGVIYGQVVAKSMSGETQQNNVICEICTRDIAYAS